GDAIKIANTAKEKGIRIVAVGIGNINRDNLALISGYRVDWGGIDTDVMIATFSNLGSRLIDLSKALCQPPPPPAKGNDGPGTGDKGKGDGNEGEGKGDIGKGEGDKGDGK